MRVVAIVQARMGSTRLPGKVLMDIAGAPMLARVIERLRRCALVGNFAIATSFAETDDLLWDYIRRTWGAYHGQRAAEQGDVLTRYVETARAYAADVIVRITADCPLIDPEVVDAVVAKLTTDPRYDHVSNVVCRTHPKGLDCEAMWADTLYRLNRLATDPADREHVTTYLYRTRPDLFRLGEIHDPDGDNSDLNFSVDYPEDLEFVRRLYADLDLANTHLGYREIVTFARQVTAGAATCVGG